MEEKNQEPKMEKIPKQQPSLETKKKKAKIAVISLSVIVALFVGMQVYASTNGYGNVFFMIKEWVTGQSVSGKEEIFSDQEITLSYKSIELAEGLKIQVNRVETKDNKSTIYLKVKIEDKAEKLIPLSYKDAKGNTFASKIKTIWDTEDKIELPYAIDENGAFTLEILDNAGTVLRTLDINFNTREIAVKGEVNLEKISQIELSKYLSLFTQLNNGNTESDVLLTIAKGFIDNKGSLISEDVLKEAKEKYTNRELTNQIIKEIYGDNAKFEMTKNSKGKDVEVVKGIYGYEYNKENDAYVALTEMSEYRYGYWLKTEDISYNDGVYTVKYIYLLACGYDEDDDNFENLPQYETTIKLRKNDDTKYSKYQIVSLEKGVEIQDKVSTKVDESKTENKNDIIDEDDTFFNKYKNKTISDKDDLTNAENVKIAIAKAGEEELKTVQRDGYYTYTDMWNNSYNIKKIKDVKTEFSELGKDKESALYKCTIYYIDNNDKDEEFDVAVLVSKGSFGTWIAGTFNSYTGSTRYTKWVGLYQEVEDEVTEQLEQDNYSNEDVKYDISIKDEVYATIKATKNGKTETKEFKMDGAIAETGTMKLPTIGYVALVAETGGESYLINIFQLVNGKIEKLGTIDCGADMVSEANYEVSTKGENTVIISAKRKNENIKKEFKMDATIDKTEVIDVLGRGKVVLVAETGGEYYAFKVFRLSQEYSTGKTIDIVKAGTIQYLF